MAEQCDSTGGARLEVAVALRLSQHRRRRSLFREFRRNVQGLLKLPVALVDAAVRTVSSRPAIQWRRFEGEMR